MAPSNDADLLAAQPNAHGLPAGDKQAGMPGTVSAIVLVPLLVPRSRIPAAITFEDEGRLVPRALRLRLATGFRLDRSVDLQIDDPFRLWETAPPKLAGI